MAAVTEHETGESNSGPRQVFVGMFDVLGFKNQLYTTGTAATAEKYRALLADVERNAETAFSKVAAQRWHLSRVVGSDTILAWSEADNADVFFGLCAQLLWTGIQHEMALRGGIAFGEAIMDRNASLYVGRPLIDAYVTESLQDWVGAALHASCLSSQGGDRMIARYELVREYDVPCKRSRCFLGGPRKRDRPRHAIAWHHYAHPDDVRLRLGTLRTTAPANVKARYDRAQRFCDENPLG